MDERGGVRGGSLGEQNPFFRNLNLDRSKYKKTIHSDPGGVGNDFPPGFDPPYTPEITFLSFLKK